MAKVVNDAPAKAVYHDVPWYVVARDDHWKLIHYLETGLTEELYDLQGDPEELVNVAGKAENRPVIERLREALKAELSRTEAGFTVQ